MTEARGTSWSSKDAPGAFASLFDPALLDELLEAVSGAIVVVDVDDTIVYASPALVELVGYRPDEVVGRPVREFVDDVVPESTLEVVGRRSGTADAGTRVRARAADGSARDLVVRGGNGSVLWAQGYWSLHLSLAVDGVDRLSALRQRLAFEDLVTGIASSFVQRPSHRIDDGIRETLAAIGTHSRVDRAFVVALDGRTDVLAVAQEWLADGIASRNVVGHTVHADELVNWQPLLARGEPVYLFSTTELPEGHEGERRFLDVGGTGAILLAPLLDGTSLSGLIGLEMVGTSRVWSDDHLTALQSTAAVVTQAMARRDAEDRVSVAFHQAPLGMAVLDAAGVHLEANDAYGELVGRPPSELGGVNVTDLIVREDRVALFDRMRLLLEGRTNRAVVEVRVAHPDRTVRLRAYCAAVRGPGGELRQVVVHVQDVSEQVERELELRTSEERYRTLVENSPAIVTRFDRRLRMVYTSPAFSRSSEAQVLADLFTSQPNVSRWQRVLEGVLATGQRADGEWSVPGGEGARWFQMRAVPEFDADGEVEHILVMGTDITELKRTEAELTHQALHDPLTGLANRTLAEETIDRLLARGATPRSLAVLFLDVDRFKVVNDSLGHTVGDQLLTVVATRLTEVMPEHATLARMGGDEFVIVLSNLTDPGEPMRVAESVRAALADPVHLGPTELALTVSIGIALLDDTHQSADALLRDADSAMYLAKARGRNRSEFCDDELRRQATDRLELEHQLRRCVDLGALDVHYQPEFAIGADGKGRIVGAEALARWAHPTRGFLEAGRFIELAEETGIIVDLGRSVLIEACRQGGEWCRRWPERKLVVRVNLSPRQLVQPDLVDVVVQAVARGGIEPSSLCLEITETALMDDPVVGREVLSQLHALGVLLAVDDFGTGYSSLAQLKRFPVDVLKIDQSFVAGLGTDPEDTAIVEAIVSMADALGLAVVAEGVENDAQLDELVRLGCRRAQGFALGRPMPGDELLSVLDESMSDDGR